VPGVTPPVPSAPKNNLEKTSPPTKMTAPTIKAVIEAAASSFLKDRYPQLMSPPIIMKNRMRKTAVKRRATTSKPLSAPMNSPNAFCAAVWAPSQAARAEEGRSKAESVAIMPVTAKSFRGLPRRFDQNSILGRGCVLNRAEIASRDKYERWGCAIANSKRLQAANPSVILKRIDS
jgi:hypothetical protein